MPSILDYLKPEFVDSKPAKDIALLFSNNNPQWRMALRVPVEHGDMVTEFLKYATKPEYRFHRRNGGGKRVHCMHLSCRREDATFFKYYFDKKD